MPGLAAGYIDDASGARSEPQASEVYEGLVRVSYLPTIETKDTQRPGAPPRLWVMPSCGLSI